MKRFAFGMLAIAGTITALACRTGQPVNDPKPEPNSPLPKVEKPDTDGTSNNGPPAPSLKRDGG